MARETLQSKRDVRAELGQRGSHGQAREGGRAGWGTAQGQTGSGFSALVCSAGRPVSLEHSLLLWLMGEAGWGGLQRALKARVAVVRRGVLRSRLDERTTEGGGQTTGHPQDGRILAPTAAAWDRSSTITPVPPLGARFLI